MDSAMNIPYRRQPPRKGANHWSGLPNPKPPMCCGEPARLTTGREIYPHRGDLADRWFYKCDICTAYCGTHRKTREPLGFPAGRELRRQRQDVHALMDPLWQTAWTAYVGEDINRRAIQASARRRVYDWLAHQLGIARDDCHTAMFDEARCIAARALLRGVTYAEIREWAKARREVA